MKRRNLEGSGRGLIAVISRKLSGGIEKNHETPE
jgi:hypothetical protein